MGNKHSGGKQSKTDKAAAPIAAAAAPVAAAAPAPAAVPVEDKNAKHHKYNSTPKD